MNHFKSSPLLALGPSSEDTVKRLFMNGIQWHTKLIDYKTPQGQGALAPSKLYFFSCIFKTLDSGAR